MKRILPLPPQIANQIAAGEVIERPASIVKELLENSLDAEANTINIDIGYGGLNQIKISDNGMGIVADDLPLAIAAYATSKITCIEDLYAITNMGFRGEALASIASIARLSISSKPAMQKTGMILECHEQTVTVTPYARTEGTTVDVRDIFFNAPVRKKFLKSEQSEFQAIDRVVKRFALGYPTIAINLNHNGKLQRQLSAALTEHARLMRMIQLLGKQFVEQSIYIETKQADSHLRAWISNACYQRSQNDKLWVYVNGRIVRDKLINHAIKQAYDGLLNPGRHPACLLYLTINPLLVDVNVHPTKHEVRFQQPRAVHNLISSQLRRHLKVTVATLDTRSDNQRLNNEFQVCETDITSNYLTNQTTLDQTCHYNYYNNGPWIFLNQRFAISFLVNQPYLVDILMMQRHYLLDCLYKASQPLTSRPLLVPIQVSYDVISEKLQAAQQLLNQTGIQTELLNNGALAIRSLPVLIPNLDIKAFLKTFFKAFPLSIKEMFDLLVNHQTLIMTINDEQRTLYLSYLQSYVRSQQLASNTITPFIKQLSQEICQYILEKCLDVE